MDMKKHFQKQQEYIPFFLRVKGIIWSIVFGALAPFIIALFALYASDDPDAVYKVGKDDVLWGVLLSLAILLVLEIKHNYLQSKNYHLYELVEKTYKWILQSHNKLPWNIKFWLSEKIENSKNKSGVVLLNICSAEYKRYLTECFSHAEKSFEAISTGDYAPDYFYSDDDMESKEKLKYLDLANSKKGLKRKIRILAYSHIKLRKSWELMESKRIDGISQVQDFFNRHSDIDLLFLDIERIKQNHFSEYYACTRYALSDDFAMFDSSIVLRKTGEFGLAFYYGKELDFQNLFDEDNIATYYSLFKNKQQIIADFNLDVL